MFTAATAAALAAALALAPMVPPPPGPTPGLSHDTACVEPTAAPATNAPPLLGGGLVLDAVHPLARGSGITVAVIDTGVSPHPRLAGRLTGGGDYLEGGDGLTDCDGHGTAVAGLLAAAPGDSDEVVGVAPEARILAIRQVSPSYSVPAPDGGRRPAGDTETLAAAIERGVALGASVIVISEAGCVDTERAQALAGPLLAALRQAVAADVLVVAAAGNVGSGGCTGARGEVALPAGVDPTAGPGPLADGVLGVGATDPDDNPAGFTMRGAWVDISARGTALRSLAPGAGLAERLQDGTSMAAPIVAGAAALVRERFPELSAVQVAQRLVDTARRTPGGWSDALGEGAVDPLAALTAPDTPTTAQSAPVSAAAPDPTAEPAPFPIPLVAVLIVLMLAPLPFLAKRLRSGR